MMRRRRPLLLLVVLLLGALSLKAHGPGRGFRSGRGFQGGHGGFYGGGGFHGGGGFYGGYGGAFDFGYGHGGLFAPPVLGYFNYWNNYLSAPYGAALPQRPQYTVVILEATHDWRYWSPTSKLIAGPVTIAYRPEQRDAPGSSPATEERVIGMGVPQWAQNASEPLGDVARRYRVLAACARSNQPFLAARAKQ